jgi:hypothetical protein
MNIGTQKQRAITSSSTACYQCSKEGHFKAQCPEWEKGRKVQEMIASLKEDEIKDLKEDFRQLQ